MLCRVEMPTNEQIFGRFYRWKLMHGPGGRRGGAAALPAVVAVAVILLLLMGLPWYMPALVALAGAGWLLFTLVLRPNQIFRQKGGAALNTEVTIFTQSGFNRSVKSEEGGFPETASMQYTALHGAVETGKDFYLFTGPAQAYLIDKEYFTKGGPEELRAALQKALGKKFTGKKK